MSHVQFEYASLLDRPLNESILPAKKDFDTSVNAFMPVQPPHLSGTCSSVPDVVVNLRPVPARW